MTAFVLVPGLNCDARVYAGVAQALWPAGPDIWSNAVFCGYHSFNGNGEMTGTIWIAEQGMLAGPVCITNTHSVGVVRDAIVAYAIREKTVQPWHLPVTAETYDGWLSDA